MDPELLNNELIELSKNDVYLKHSIKNVLLAHFKIKKKQHMLWHILHSFSVMYPEVPTEQEKQQVKDFISKLDKNIPTVCSSCSSKPNTTFMDNTNLDEVASSKNNLILFFCEYHKFINTTHRPLNTNYNPSSFNVDFVINRYTTYKYIDFIEQKYNVNLYTLFLNNDMFSFFNTFNKIAKLVVAQEQFDFELHFKSIE